MQTQRPANAILVTPVRRTVIIAAAMFTAILLFPLLPLPSPQYRMALPYKVELLLSILLIVGMFTRRFFTERNERLFTAPKRPISWLFVGILLFIVWSGISISWARFPLAALNHTLIWAIYLGILVLFFKMIEQASSLLLPTTTFALISLIIGVLIAVEYLTAADITVAGPNLRVKYVKFAEMLVTLLPVVFASAIYVRKRQKMMLFIFLGLLGWAGTLLTLSRAALVSGTIGFGMFFLGALLFAGSIFRRRIIFTAAAWLVLTFGLQIAIAVVSKAPTTAGMLVGSSEQAHESNEMRVFFWKVGLQMASDHWMAGVGGDNFGTEFNASRARFRETHPADMTREIGEDILVERAHNEPLQIFAELGIIGLSLFVGPLFIFAGMFVLSLKKRHIRSSPMFLASSAGIVAFAVSSMFSSFSFRAAQNGAVFVLTLAIALSEMTKHNKIAEPRSDRSPVLTWWKWPSLACAFLMAALCIAKGYAEYYEYRAEHSIEREEAQRHLSSALSAYPEYSGALLTMAAAFSSSDQPALAIEQWRKAIDNGMGTSVTYGYLAKDQVRAGDLQAAMETYIEAIRIFPRSEILRAEYAVFLEKQGSYKSAQEQLELARRFDEKQANGWYVLIKNGPLVAFTLSETDPNVAPPASLIPPSAVRQYLDPMPSGK